MTPVTDTQFRMIRPCTHCPFRTDDQAIRFSGRERPEEIEECLPFRLPLP